MDLISRIRVWEKSEADAIPLALVLLVSPLMPLVTLRQLKGLREYEYLPDPEEMLSGNPGFRHLSDKMREVLQTALLAQRAGKRSVLEQKLEELLGKTASELEVSSYHITQLFQFSSLFITVIPVTVVSVVFFISLSLVTNLLLACALIAVVAGGLLGFGVFPRELALPAPPIKSFIAAAPIPLVYLILYMLGRLGVGVECPALLSVAAGSVLLSALQLVWRRRVLSAYREARELVRRAGVASYNVFAALGVVEPEYLLSDKWVGVARAATTSLYMLCLFGGRGLEAALRRLETYVGRYLDYLLRVRGRMRAMFIYGLIETLVVACTYAILVATLQFFGTMPWSAAATGMRMPTQAELAELLCWLDLVLAVDSVALALATAAAREGQPLLFGIYLPPLSGAMWLGYVLGLRLAPLLFT